MLSEGMQHVCSGLYVMLFHGGQSSIPHKQAGLKHV